MAKKQTRSRWKPRNAGTSAARLAAVQGLYEMAIAGASFDNVLMDHMHDRWSGLQGHTAGDELDRKKFGEVVKGVTVGKARYDEMIANVLEKERTLDGMDVLMLTILRAGLHELFAEPGTPAKVIITEYVGIARSFYNENEPALINGILDRVAKVLRGDTL